MRQITFGRRFWRRGGTILVVAGVCVAFAGSALAQDGRDVRQGRRVDPAGEV